MNRGMHVRQDVGTRTTLFRATVHCHGRQVELKFAQQMASGNMNNPFEDHSRWEVGTAISTGLKYAVSPQFCHLTVIGGEEAISILPDKAVKEMFKQGVVRILKRSTITSSAL
jgi:hypothetical protein